MSASTSTYLEKDTLRNVVKYVLIIGNAVLFTFYLIGLSPNTGWSELKIGLNELFLIFFTSLLLYFTIIETRMNETQYKMFLIQNRPLLSIDTENKSVSYRAKGYILIKNDGKLPAIDVKVFEYKSTDDIDKPTSEPEFIPFLNPNSKTLVVFPNISPFIDEFKMIRIEYADSNHSYRYNYYENIVIE